MFNKVYVNTVKKMFREAVDTFGKDITVYYHTTENCDYCSANPITGESMNSNCSTCGGTQKIYTDRILEVKGVAKNFVTSFGQYMPQREQFMWGPTGDGRLTCELEPFLEDSENPTGGNILNYTDYVSYDNQKYKVRNYSQINMLDFYLIVITLEKYSGNDVRN